MSLFFFFKIYNFVVGNNWSEEVNGQWSSILNYFVCQVWLCSLSLSLTVCQAWLFVKSCLTIWQFWLCLSSLTVFVNSDCAFQVWLFVNSDSVCQVWLFLPTLTVFVNSVCAFQVSLFWSSLTCVCHSNWCFITSNSYLGHWSKWKFHKNIKLHI